MTGLPLAYAGRALVVDDSTVSRKIARRLLENEGIEVLEAEDGAAALTALSAPDAPTLLLIDWEMPGITGPELVRALRTSPVHRGRYVLLVTAKETPEALVEGLESGADDFVRKPFRPDELRARVRAGTRVLALQDELAEKVRRLEGALTEVRQLRGLIPICMHCRRVRTTSEQWQGIEKYIEAHSDAAFSHSICDECMDIHYPDPARDPANPSSGVEPPDDERTGKERAA